MIQFIYIISILIFILSISNIVYFKKRKFTYSIVIFSLIFFTCFIFISRNNIDENEWYVDYLNYEELHNYSTGEKQKIALIDSGISEQQSETKETESLTFVDSRYDSMGHGSMLYSIIKGFEDEIIGIAPDAEILSIKLVSAEEGSITPEKIVQALEIAIDKDSDIINFSLGSFIEDEDVLRTIEKALANGIFVVASTGDYGIPEMLFPAYVPGVLAVGAISSDLEVAPFSSAPNKSLINSPGDDIKSLGLDNEIEYTFGTSQATAIISGYIALLNSYADQEEVNLTNDRLHYLLGEINDKNIKYVEAFGLIEKGIEN